mmetsp:Transcript_43237/g.113575  ORF Transcript_43237/g.113575 Transcript_43237/m.113575 type:complete len:316 (-) Transcript_43237:292-1239(-)
MASSVFSFVVTCPSPRLCVSTQRTQGSSRHSKRWHLNPRLCLGGSCSRAPPETLWTMRRPSPARSLPCHWRACPAVERSAPDSVLRPRPAVSHRPRRQDRWLSKASQQSSGSSQSPCARAHHRMCILRTSMLPIQQLVHAQRAKPAPQPPLKLPRHLRQSRVTPMATVATMPAAATAARRATKMTSMTRTRTKMGTSMTMSGMRKRTTTTRMTIRWCSWNRRRGSPHASVVLSPVPSGVSMPVHSARADRCPAHATSLCRDTCANSARWGHGICPCVPDVRGLRCVVINVRREGVNIARRASGDSGRRGNIRYGK